MKRVINFILFALVVTGMAFAQQGSSAPSADDNAALQQKIRDLEERLIVHGVRLTRQTPDLPLDAARAGVVGRRRQVHAAQPLHQILEVVDRGVGCFEGITPLVYPGINDQAVTPSRRRHELPHPRGAGAADGGIRQAAFNEREIHQILGQAPGAQPFPNHAFIAAES